MTWAPLYLRGELHELYKLGIFSIHVFPYSGSGDLRIKFSHTLTNPLHWAMVGAYSCKSARFAPKIIRSKANSLVLVKLFYFITFFSSQMCTRTSICGKSIMYFFIPFTSWTSWYLLNSSIMPVYSIFPHLGNTKNMVAFSGPPPPPIRPPSVDFPQLNYMKKGTLIKPILPSMSHY